MLVLTRKINEKIKIGESIVVSVLDVDGGNVKLGIDAPREISIVRVEVLEKVLQENIDSSERQVEDIAEAATLFKSRFVKE